MKYTIYELSGYPRPNRTNLGDPFRSAVSPSDTMTSAAWAISGLGPPIEVVGVADDLHAAHWSVPQAGGSAELRWAQARPLGGLDAVNSYATCISELNAFGGTGMIGGFLVTNDAKVRGFAYVPLAAGGPFSFRIGTLWPDNSESALDPWLGTSQVFGIASPTGQSPGMLTLVGGADTSSGVHAFRWEFREGQQMFDLGTLDGPRSCALSVNRFGLIVGWSDDGGNVCAAVWSRSGRGRGSSLSAGALDGATPIHSVATAVAGSEGRPEIVGSYQTADGVTHACRFVTRGNPGNLRPAIESFDHDPSRSSEALDVNDWGVAVGRASEANTDFAFVAPQGGELKDLTDLVVLPPTTTVQPIGSPTSSKARVRDYWVLHSATGINNRGEIVGSGLFRGERRGFLLVPTP
jgi:probable HAF family extracellular repeat protein